MTELSSVVAGRAFLMNETTVGRRAAGWSPTEIMVWLEVNYEGGWNRFVTDISAK